MEDKCIKCSGSPVYIKKRKLCKSCYVKWYYSNSSRHKTAMIYHNSEVEFIKNFFDHKNWIYQPVHFRLNGDSYNPDFYDGERNIFIEVAGTRQAFDANKEKYRQFIAVYPKINFEIRYSDGCLLDMNDGFHRNKENLLNK